MGKGIVIFFFSSLFLPVVAEQHISRILWQNMAGSRVTSFRMPRDAFVHPGVSHYIYPSDGISKSEAISIAKANVDFYVLLSATANLRIMTFFGIQMDPQWVVTLKGQITKSYPAEWVTKVVIIDGNTGRVISVT